MANKLKFAFFWGASCGGCEVAVLDINDKILDVAALADIVLWPLAVDGKYKDIEALPDKMIDVCFFNGGVRNTEIERVAKLLREKSKVLVAFGACANMGGVPGLANQFSRENILKRVYETTESTVNEERTLPQAVTMVPEGELVLPELFERVLPLDEVVGVDYYLPGCPPTAEWVAAAVEAIAKGELPPLKSVIGGVKTLCDECPRERKNERSIKRFYRPHEIMPDPKVCLLEQGVVCCGPATRSGCKAACVTVNMPCRGCYGAPAGVVDQGAKMMSAAASLVASDDEEEITAILAGIKDPMGTFYQFGLPRSILKGSLEKAFVGPEKRKHERIKATFVISYRILEEASDDELVREHISQTKNIGLGGMMLTTNKLFRPWTKLVLEISLPSDPHPIMLLGRVVDSSEIVRELVYDTRLEFLAVDEEHRSMLGKTTDGQERV
ncbi:MAG: NADH-quinone oxidoreductase subunit B family protein [Endomicrobiales bacterium]